MSIGTCMYCRNETASGCGFCNPTLSHNVNSAITDDDVTTAEELRLIRYQLEEMKADLKSMMDLLVKSRIKPKVRGVPQKRRVYSILFEEAWRYCLEIKPQSNNKGKAADQWCARTKEGVSGFLMRDAARDYAAYVKATGVLPKMGSTFFGPAEHYLEDFTIPKPEPKKVVIPTEVKALVKFAREHGMESKPGESTWDFRQRVETAVRGGDV